MLGVQHHHASLAPGPSLTCKALISESKCDCICRSASVRRFTSACGTTQQQKWHILLVNKHAGILGGLWCPWVCPHKVRFVQLLSAVAFAIRVCCLLVQVWINSSLVTVAAVLPAKCPNRSLLPRVPAPPATCYSCAD